MEPLREQDNFEVRFAIKEIKPRKNEVVIFPQDDGWNDFGFYINHNFIAKSPLIKEPFSGRIFLGFLESEDFEGLSIESGEYDRISLYTLLDTLSKGVAGPEELPNFFTLLPDMASYRDIVLALGSDEAARLLHSVNDLVVSRSTRNKWFDRAIESEVFSRGFMRNSEPFFAFHNADSVLNGVLNEDLSAVSKSIDLSFSLEGFANSHRVKFRFGEDGIVPRRINVLIGKNGLGKSQTLRLFCRAALGYKDQGVEFRDHDTGSDRPMISRILAVATPGETANTFPAERKKTQKLYYRRLQLTRNGRSKLSNSIGASLVQLVRREETISGSERWDIFVEALRRVLPVESVVIPTIDGREIPILSLAEYRGEQATLDMWSNVDLGSDPKIRLGGGVFPLSSGQLTYFKFALLCSLYIENGSFVLMDEPETHMHPNMISDFVDLLDTLLERTGSQAILATHSAYFVREVPRQQVHVFQSDIEQAIYIGQPRLSTFGATLDSISQFVFNEDVEVRLTNKIFRGAREMSFEQVDEQLSEEVSLAALMDIKRRFEEEG